MKSNRSKTKLSSAVRRAVAAFVLTTGFVTNHAFAQPTSQPSTNLVEAETADGVLHDLAGTPIPTFDRTKAGDATYGAAFERQFQQTLARRAELVGQLLRLSPTDPHLRALEVERWRALGQLNRGNEAADEIAPYFARENGGGAEDAKVAENAAYYAAVLEIEQISKTDADRLAAVDRYRERSKSGAALQAVLNLVSRRVTDNAVRIDVANRIIQAAPDSREADFARGMINRINEINKPFELSFNDVIDGSPVSVNGALKGKVVVLDFWATWCAPCKAYVPRLKTLYDAKHADGLEIVSISLDEAGDENVERLRKTAAKEGMNWHHYFAGDGFNSAFSKKWGIDFIPQIFVIDRAGRLVSVDARDHIEDVVAKLLTQ